jgi:NAD(P)-dependent dehydrogenase (short-subunit alcohol dehydrogenase family)
VELKVAKRSRRPTASQGTDVSLPSVASPGSKIRANLTLSGRTAFVTGAFGGLGRHFALTLARAGAKVALAGRRIAEGERLAEQITKEGGQATVVALDVSAPENVSRAIAQAAETFGPINVLVNNAGVAVTKPALDWTESDWASVVGVNLTGAWRVAQAVGRHMKEHGEGGSIINITSILGHRVASHVVGYVASKAGLTHLTQALALELARYKIRVNALAPGYIETDLNREFFNSEAGQALIGRVPQRRLGKPEHLDGPLLLLASDASEFMTGATIVVDGGHLVSTL